MGVFRCLAGVGVQGPLHVKLRVGWPRRDSVSIRDAADNKQTTGDDPPLASMLDALVRNTRAGSPPSNLVDRLYQAWCRDCPRPIELGVVGVRAGASAVETEGGWAFNAFIAGIRSIEPTPDTVTADIEALARQLAAVRYEVAAAERLRSWAWEEDGESFRISLARSFTEVMEASDGRPDLAGATLSALRDAAAGPLTGGVRIASAALDRAATRPELDVDIGEYRTDSRGRAHEVDGAKLRGLTQDIADPSAWAELELDVLMCFELTAKVAPARLGRRAASCIGGHRPHHGIEFLAQLRTQHPELASRVTNALNADELADELASSTTPERVGRSLAEWAAGGDDLGKRVVTALVRRAHTSDKVARLASRVIMAPSISARITETMEVNHLPAESASWILPQLPEDAQVALVADLEADPATSALLASDPSRLVRTHGVAVARCLRDASAAGREALALTIVDATPQTDGRTLADIIRATANTNWDPRVAARVCARLARDGLTREALLPLALSRTAEPALRIAAVNALGCDRVALNAALRFRWSALLDPPTVRAAFRRAKRRRR